MQLICEWHSSELSSSPLRAGEEMFSAIPSRGWLAKYIYTKTEMLTVSCMLTWACSERTNLYNR
jgi:hypothetical protein